MSTATVTGHPSGEPLADPGERGRLEVSTRAVERIAQQVAVPTPGIGGGGRRVLGVQVSEASSDARPRVSAAVAWPVARLHVEVAVEYPHPIVPTVAELRRRLADPRSPGRRASRSSTCR